MSLKYEDLKSISEWIDNYAGFDGQIERLEWEVDNLKNKLLGLATLLVDKGICSVDDIYNL